jgi:hypothetical protein
MFVLSKILQASPKEIGVYRDSENILAKNIPLALEYTEVNDILLNQAIVQQIDTLSNDALLDHIEKICKNL